MYDILLSVIPHNRWLFVGTIKIWSLIIILITWLFLTYFISVRVISKIIMLFNVINISVSTGTGKHVHTHKHNQTCTPTSAIRHTHSQTHIPACIQTTNLYKCQTIFFFLNGRVFLRSLWTWSLKHLRTRVRIHPVEPPSSAQWI